MSTIRRSAAALTLTLGMLGALGVGVVATAAPSGAQPACTDSWIGSDTGTTNWNASGSNWSDGLPGGSSIACINEAGTYTVLWNGSGSAAAVEVGGAASGIQTFEISGGNFPTTQDSEVLSGGELSLASSSSSDAILSGGSNSLTVDAGGSLSTSGTTENANVALPLVNQGSMTLGATTNLLSGDTITNEGSVSVLSGSTVTENAATFTDASGSLVNNGTFNGENEWIQSGTNESGNPVLANVGTFIDSAGTGSFQVHTTTIEGTVPAGQTVTALGSDAMGTSSVGLTVEGTLDCETTATSPFCSFYTDNSSFPGITVATGGALETSGPGSNPLCANAGCADISANLQIDAGGTYTVSNPYSVYSAPAYSGSGPEGTLISAGTVQVTSTGWLWVSGCASFESNGTLGVTVGSSVPPPSAHLGNPGTIEADQCPSNVFDVGGTLAVDTDGTPTSQTVITNVAAEMTSVDFSNFSFGLDYYAVSYPSPSGEVEVTPGTPFSAFPTTFSAAEGEPVTTPQVAAFTTNGEPGTYSASVNYGDATGTQPATVTPSGVGGTVAGLTHTFIAPGTYTVTTTISSSAGTTIPVSKSVTVTGPTVTGLSKHSLAPHKSLTTIVTGTNFDGTGAPARFSTSDPSNLMVVAVTYKTATKKKPAEYKVKLKAAKTAPAESVSLTLTQVGIEAGQTTDTGAISIT